MWGILTRSICHCHRKHGDIFSAISFSFFLCFCIFVSFLTVALALRKPMKIVSRISPIEATRYLENAETHKKGKRNGRIVKLQFKLSMINGKTCFMLRVNIPHIIRDNHKQYARKTHCEDSTNSSFGITRYICHCHRKHGDIFSAISFSFFVCFCIF